MFPSFSIPLTSHFSLPFLIFFRRFPYLFFRPNARSSVRHFIRIFYFFLSDFAFREDAPGAWRWLEELILSNPLAVEWPLGNAAMRQFSIAVACPLGNASSLQFNITVACPLGNVAIQ